MYYRTLSTLSLGAAGVFLAAGALAAQDHSHEHTETETSEAQQDFSAQTHSPMWMTMLPGGWHLMGMAHIFPVASFSAPFSSDSPLQRTDLDFPHSGAMVNVESPASRVVFRLMPNFEGLTLPDGEPTFGGWGEGFIDARHPHTLLHEAMLSFNWWEAPGGAFSISAGRGFAPYGTDDPMYRPALKYPTNHHLSQILERWTLNATYISDGGWGVEAGIFDGDEPEDPWDVGNYRNFGNSWSARLSRRLGGQGTAAPWELSASFGQVRETHDGHRDERTTLYNAAVRHDASYDFGGVYGLLEASRSDPEEGEGYFSLLAEAQLGLGSDGARQPYYRVEHATRPEYPRQAQDGEDFFRYDHGVHAAGATRWTIQTLGYSHTSTELPLSARPFVEVSHNRITHERGPDTTTPDHLFGGGRFWSFAAGVRLYLGGGPMRMGTYGTLDPMTAGMREGMPPSHDQHVEPEHDHLEAGRAPSLPVAREQSLPNGGSKAMPHPDPACIFQDPAGPDRTRPSSP